MKRIFSFLLLIICYTANAQTPEKISYYYQGKKISFPVNYERLVIQLAPGEKPEGRRGQIAAMLQLADTALKQMADKRMLSAKMPVGAAIARVKDNITSLGKLAFIGFVHPVFKSPSGKDMGYGDELVIKLKAGTSIAAFEDFVKKSNCSIVKKYAFAEKIYIVSAGPANNFDAAETANRFFEKGLFEYAEPDLTLFDGLTAAPNDPLYGYQWSHNNTGSAIQYSGTAGVDMKVQQAWGISKGAGIRVAVIDQGVDLAHPDLQANLLQGFDAISGTANPGDGKPLSPNNGHGTSCSGIIAAVADNNTGIDGVAPESKIIPINVVDASGFFTAYTGLAAAFDYAWQHGADVISNSWGGGNPSQLLDDAITRAVTQGRGGKGSVVLFASGNDNSVLSYPATNPSVIAVGGANMCGQQKSPSSCDGEYWWGANYGVGLDVVAPCVKIPATDITGTGGYNTASGTDGNYFLTFNGTSSATPNTAGVVALILAVNNNITVAQARGILEGSCAKLPGYGYGSNPDQPNGSWNSETGYGFVDAYSAVQTASTGGPCSVQISSNIPALFCPGGNVTLSVLNPIAGTNYQWRKNGINLSTGNNIVTNASGSYNVVATQASGCIAYSAPIVVPDKCQVLLSNNEPVTTCDALFYDSGGSTGNYNNNETFTKTFSPTAAGKLVQLQIDSFDIEDGDLLSFYDGINTNNLIGGIGGRSTNPQWVTSVTGALTVSFTSNGSGTARGWFGKIGCYQSNVFRSKKTGAYSDLSTWEMKSGSGFVNALLLPSASDDSIIIRTGHTVTIDQSVQLNQLLVEQGAVLRLNQTLYVTDGPGDDLVVNGTVEIGNAILSINYPGTLILNGNLVATTAGGALYGKIDVKGSAAQTIAIGANAFLDWLSITNPAVSINLQGNASIDQIELNNNGKLNVNGAYTLLLRRLTLASGRMIINNSGLLNIQAPTAGTIIGGSEASFIEGPLRRNTNGQGAQTLFFPIGKDVYRPVSLTVTAPAGGFSSYQAQVFNSAPASRTLPASLNAVSNTRYVRIINAGVQAPTAAAVMLSYGPDEGLPYNSSSLRIAKDDGVGNWVDIGGSGGGNATGNVISTVNFTSFSDFVLATAQNAIPGCTSNTIPANGTTISTSSTAALGWNAVINATSYDVFIWTGATAPSLPTATVATTSYNATGLTASTTYNWFILPKNASGYLTSDCINNKTSFTTAGGAAVPACVANTSPANATTLITQTTARLIWPASNSTTSYDVYMATGNAVPTALVTNVTGLTYYASNLTPGTLYSWYIAPRNADGANTACGATNKTTFTTAVATGGGNLSPVANAGGDKAITLPVNLVTLDGSASYDPDGRIAEFYWYQIQGPVTASISSNFSTFPNITGLTTAGKYIFGLQVKDNNGVTAYSQMTVTVNAAGTAVPACTTNTAPANGSTIGTTTTVTLSWGLVVNAASYDVYLWTGATAPLTPTASNVIGTSYDATGLTASALYHWYVVPKNANGAATGCSANTTTFTTAAAAGLPACVDNIFPVNGTVLLTQTTARLKWPASPGAASYDVYLQTGTGVPTVLFANVTDLTYYMTFLTPGITFSWYIAPRNANGANTGCGSTNRTTFTTAAATGGANLAPVSNAGSDIPITLPATAVQLDGTGSYDPDGRIVQYYWYQAQGPVASSISNAFSVNPTVTGLTTAGNYIFGLQVKDNNGATAYSQTTVTVNPGGTGTAPACVTNTSPTAGAILATQNTATLTWSSSATATSYDVYLAAGTGIPTVLATNTTLQTYSATGLTAGTTYSWYIAPRNASGANTGCATSNRTTFTTAATVPVPACVVNTAPGNGEPLKTQTTATLTWPSSSTATSYDVYLAAGTGTPATLVANTTALTYNASGLTAGSFYSWYIAPRNASGANTVCGASNTTRFTTAAGATVPACVTNTSPASGSTLPTQTSAWFTWPASAGATSYDVYLAAGNGVPTVLAINIPQLTYYATNLTAGTLYSWYVAPRNANGANTACGSTNRTTFTTAVATGGGNIAPVANGGSNTSITLPLSSVTLDGSASYDPDGRIAEFYWYRLQAPVFTGIDNVFSVKPNITGLATAGTYIYGLQVKDNNGVTAYSQTTVTVKAAGSTAATTNALQTANAEAAQTATAAPLITGSVSPNPVMRGRFARLQINSYKKCSAVIDVVNSSGSILSTQQVNLVRGVNTTGIGTSSLAQGLYIIHISGADKPINIKLMVIN